MSLWAGAAAYLGEHFCDLANRQGHEITIVANRLEIHLSLMA